MTTKPYKVNEVAGLDAVTGEPLYCLQMRNRWPPDSGIMFRVHNWDEQETVHTNDTNVYYDSVFTMFFRSKITGKLYLTEPAVNICLGIEAEDDVPSAAFNGLRFNQGGYENY
jgi:hypothetical protein